MAIDTSWSRYGRTGWRNKFTGEVVNQAAQPAPIPMEKILATPTGKLASNIAAQGTIDKWSGQGHGNPYANAYDMARILTGIGITRLEDFGEIKKTIPGAPIYSEPTVIGYANDENMSPIYSQGGELIGYEPDTVVNTWGNKVTGQTVPNTYSERQTGNAWGGTFAGDGNTGYRVSFNELGMPMFYTTYASSADDLGPLNFVLSAASIIPGPWQPFAMAANAVLQASQGNTFGAVLSALGAANAYGQAFNTLPTEIGTQSFDIDTLGDYAAAGVEQTAANFLATNAGTLTSVTQGVQLLNALDKKNLAGVIGSLANLSPQIGITIPEDVMKPIQYATIASAASKGDWVGATLAAATLTNNSNLRLAGNGLNLVNAFKSEDPTRILSSMIAFGQQAQLGAKTIKDTAKQAGIPLSDKDAEALYTSDDPDAQVKEYYALLNQVKTSYKSNFGEDATPEMLNAFAENGGILDGYNNYVTDMNTTTGSEVEELLSKSGLTTKDLNPESIFQALALPEKASEAYVNQLIDIRKNSFDGSKFDSTETAAAAAIKAGKNTFIAPDGNTYNVLPGEVAQKIIVDASKGKNVGIDTNSLQTISGVPLRLYDSVDDIPEIIITATKFGKPSPTDAQAWADYQKELKDLGGASFSKFFTDQLDILTEAFKGAKPDTAASALKNAMAFGARNFGSLSTTLLRGAEAFGLDKNTAALRVSQALERWGKANQSAGVLDAEDKFTKAINGITKETLAAQLKTTPDKISDLQVASAQIKELGRQAVTNPLGTLSVVGGEALQEVPFLVASGGIGSVAAKIFGKAAGFAVARGTDAGLNGYESFSGNYAEVKDYLIRQGVPASKAESRALASGLEAMAVTAATSWVGDTTALRVLMGDSAKLAATAVVGASAKEFVMGYAEGAAQNISAQIGKFGEVRNLAEVTASGAIEGFVQGGLTAGVVTPSALSQVVAKGYDGASVTLNDIVTGAKTFDPSTLVRSAVLAGGITINNALQYNEMSAQGLAASPAQYTQIVKTFESEGYAPNASEIAAVANASPDATDAQLAAAVSKYADPLNTTKEEAKSFYKEIFGVDPTDSQLTAFIGKSESVARGLVNEQFNVQQTNTANAKKATDAGFPDYATYTQYGGNVANYNAAVTAAANAKIATEAGFPDFATYTQYGGDKKAYNTAQTAAANKKTATDAGFPDFATYTQYAGNVNAYNTAVQDAANIRTATNAGFPDYATFKQYNGDIAAYTAAKTAERNKTIATEAGFPDFATYTQYNGDRAAYNAAVSAAANAKVATDAGFPDFAAYTQYAGDLAAYNTAKTNEANTKTATQAGFPDYASYTKYNGDIGAYNTATTAAANTKKATEAGFPDFDTYTRYEGNAANYKADLTAKSAGFADAAEQTAASTAGYTDATAYKNHLADVANTNKATTAGFPDYGTYTQFNGDLAAYNASRLASETTTAINNAIAGIKFPAGVSSTDVAAQIKAAMEANPSLKATDVANAISAYMTANPGLTATDLSTAISTATKGLATTQDVANAIAGIKFPAGITAADVAAEIKKAMDDNPGLSVEDVTKSITDYMAANPGLTAADVSTAITNATSDFVTNTSFEKALSDLSADAKTQFEALTQGQKDVIALQVAQGKDFAQAITDVSSGFQSKIDTLTGDVKSQFDTLTQGQKDIVAAYTQQGVDINKAIADAATLTNEQVTSVKNSISQLSGDVKTKFDTLTQGQKDIVNSQLQMGVDLNTAISNASKQTTEQIAKVETDLTKNIYDVQTQFNTRVDELVLAGRTYQEATQQALGELGKGVTGLTSSVEDIQKKQAEEAAARRSAQAQAKAKSNLGDAMSLIAPAAASAAAAAGSDDTPYRQIGLKTTGEAKFEGPLEQYLKMVKENTYASKPTQPETQQQNQQVAPVQDELSSIQQQQPQENNYFNYGQQSEIDHLLQEPEGTGMLYSKAGGLATPLFAGGGTTRHGRYSGGGLGVVHHSGKPRLDFRKGDAVTGAGDGQSDDIPAMLADGEFVIPADVVAALGNGSTKAGSDKLYDMMHSIRAYHRAAKPKDLPPPAKKSPLDYLKKPASKARR